MISDQKLPVTVLIMTQNEEKNIKFTLDSVVRDFDQIIVTDSYSEDGTIEVVKQFPGVQIYENKFISWADQRNWMIDNCSIRNETVFFLDADEVVLPAFVNELKVLITQDFNAVEIKADMYFLGKHIKYAYGHPFVKRIFKKKLVKFSGSGAREYSNVQDNILRINCGLRHEDRKGLSYWIHKHNNNSSREAILLMQNSDSVDSTKFTKFLRFKLFIRNHVWNRLPLAFRPFLYFVYRYIFQLGFLDGREGFIYCFFHGFWYHMLIDSKVIELRNEVDYGGIK